MRTVPEPQPLRARIKGIISDVGAGLGLSPAQITDDAYLVRDLNFDSLSLVAIAAELGLAFDFEPPEDLFDDAAFQSVLEVTERCARAVEAAARGAGTDMLDRV